MRLNRIVIYARDVDATAAFYERHFGFRIERTEADRIMELIHPEGGVILMLHQASKGQKVGQSTVKLTFDVDDVDGARAKAAREGLIFGPLHRADGYVFANARDPDGNPLSISGRAYRHRKLDG